MTGRHIRALLGALMMAVIAARAGAQPQQTQVRGDACRGSPSCGFSALAALYIA